MAELVRSAAATKSRSKEPIVTLRERVSTKRPSSRRVLAGHATRGRGGEGRGYMPSSSAAAGARDNTRQQQPAFLRAALRPGPLTARRSDGRRAKALPGWRLGGGGGEGPR